MDEKDNLTPFTIVGGNEASLHNELADKLGLIEVVLFVKGSANSNNKKESDDMLTSRHLSLRKLSPYYQKKLSLTRKPQTPAEARGLAFKSAGLKLPSQPAKARGPRIG